MAKPPVPGAYGGLFCAVSCAAAVSASPARRRLLEQAGVPIGCVASGDEGRIHHADPAELGKLLAQAKAHVAQQLDPVHAEITAVLGCDSVPSFEGQVFISPRASRSG